MKTAAILALIAGSASAFAPMPASKATTSLNVNPELEGMVGYSVENGNKVVSLSLKNRSEDPRHLQMIPDQF